MFAYGNVIRLTKGATIGDLTSLEDFIGKAFRKNIIPKAVAPMLWKIFGMLTVLFLANILEKDKDYNAKDTSEKNQASNNIEAHRGALIILTMMANVDPSIIKAKLNVVISSLGKRSRADPLIAKYACIALQKLVLNAPVDPSAEKTNETAAQAGTS